MVVPSPNRLLAFWEMEGFDRYWSLMIVWPLARQLVGRYDKPAGGGLPPRLFLRDDRQDLRFPVLVFLFVLVYHVACSFWFEALLPPPPQPLPLELL
mmetsp:Transcript_57566/g.122436  ORF Transcript_57566/g.122436 Transcript_57566/m.122436 type:complete len:97 (-) Transcript_57566:206-496(-)